MSLVDIKIDGKKISAKQGAMLIEAADEAGIYIPRFCYHKKLSVAANCRMCLVEVKNVKKPLPACATPVTPAMEAFTQSKMAMEAQKAVMEFLLINHPLDCPICDQGGECELQDFSMGYGKGVSEFVETKRSVKDEDLGPLISTEMTRCIHCTRCVRFGEEVAGVKELGATYRGEDMRIGTYVKHFVQSELSGNIIDLCPVGALTSKPYRFSGRPWEMQQHPSIAPHDGVGSNLYIHTRGFIETDYRKVMRVVPRENEAVNENWISDRDRFSYEGLNSEDRVAMPMIKDKNNWKTVDWPVALNFVANAIQRIDHKKLGALASASATLEELYLFQKLLRGLDCSNIDHRLHQSDFSQDPDQPLAPHLGVPIEQIENQQAILLVGSYARDEQPLINHRIRKAFLKGASIMSVNMVDRELNYDVEHTILTSASSFGFEMAAIAKALGVEDKLLSGVKINDTHKAIAEQLKKAERALVLLGPSALNQAQAGFVSSMAQLISKHSGACLGMLNEGANAAGAWLAGAIPHRTPAGQEDKQPGLNAREMFENPLSAYLLLGVEPEFDSAYSGAALKALKEAFVVSLSPYRGGQIEDYCDVILPIAPFSENSGTFVNLEGKWQSFQASTRPWQQVRPAWKVLRVLGNLLNLDGFDYESSQAVRDELKETLDQSKFETRTPKTPDTLPEVQEGLSRLGDWHVNRIDALVRRSHPLQLSKRTTDKGYLKITPYVTIHPVLAKKLNLKEGDKVNVSQKGGEACLPVHIKEIVSENDVIVMSGFEETVSLTCAFGPVTLKKEVIHDR